MPSFKLTAFVVSILASGGMEGGGEVNLSPPQALTLPQNLHGQ